MIKIIGFFLIMFGSTTIGFKYSKALEKRLSQLQELEAAVVNLQNEISYAFTPLPDAFNKVSSKIKGPIRDTFLSISNILVHNEVQNVYDAACIAIKRNIDKLYLNKDDIQILLDLCRNLGQWDVEGHKSVFLLILNNLKTNIKQAQSLKEKNSKMYKALGFSVGAILVILLI